MVSNQKTPVLSIERRGFYLAISECKYVTGVAMLSGVLNSDRAIKVNIQIMRTFTQLRNMLTTHEDLKHKIEAMERTYDKQEGET